MIKPFAFVFKGNQDLIGDANFTVFEFAYQAFFIDILKESRPLLPVNFNGGTNYCLAPCVCPGIVFVYASD